MEVLEAVRKKRFVLGSQSPRRQNMFAQLGLNYIIRPMPIDESFDSSLKADEIPMYLAQQKAVPQLDLLQSDDILVTADTVVWINDHALNKPEDLYEARAMLKEISGAVHEVYTGVCLTSPNAQHTFAEGTEVHFNELADIEIEYYLDRFAPLDKAGAYGIQEFIGYIGIQKVVGDFYNVVGFPVQRFWREIEKIL
ncbi:MAG: Maf-like protein [Salibacteraceae bacterium]